MDNLFIKGPDALKLISRHRDQPRDELPRQQGQAVRARPRPYGHVIGDGILFHEAEDEFVYVGRAPAANWLQFHGETGGYRRRDRASTAARRRGPMGKPVKRTVLALPDPGPERLAGHREAQRRPARAAEVLQHGPHARSPARKVRTLRHGMAGAPGLEIWGPYEEHDEIRDAILEAGKEFGLRRRSARRAYPSNTLESGWIPSPLPAIYTGEKLQGATASGCGADSYEAHRLDRRQLRLRQHRGLLPHPVGARLRPVREVRPRLHRPRGAREDRPEPRSARR